MAKRASTDKLVTTYRRFPVYLSGSGLRFYAGAGGKHHHAGSWDTLRKKLDGAADFEPFDALQLSYDRGKGYVEQIHITGLDMEDGSWIVSEGGKRRGGTRIKFYQDIFPLSLRDQLETHLGELEEWSRQEEIIKTARAAEQARFRALKLKDPREDKETDESGECET